MNDAAANGSVPSWHIHSAHKASVSTFVEMINPKMSNKNMGCLSMTFSCLMELEFYKQCYSKNTVLSNAVLKGAHSQSINSEMAHYKTHLLTDKSVAV